MFDEYGEAIEIPEGMSRLAVKVLGMGWTWACVLAQVLLETVAESSPMISRAFRVSDVLKIPCWEEEGDRVHWGFIDDYAGMVRGGQVPREADITA